MTIIKLITKIKADKKTVFDLSRNIDAHRTSMTASKEKAIAGRTSGLINLNETVTWQGRHFGLLLKHQSKITEMSLHDSFTDEMLEGCFKSFKHTHLFKEENGVTLMIDCLQYETPFGILGAIPDGLFLKNYMTNLIRERNCFIKTAAEKV
jgi:ligand-binding SRPBCC domain-containing protein